MTAARGGWCTRVQFPHKRLDARMHCTFLEAAFALAEAREGEQIREQILLGVVDILLQVDVDIRWEDIMALQEEDEEEQAVLAKLRHKKATEGVLSWRLLQSSAYRPLCCPMYDASTSWMFWGGALQHGGRTDQGGRFEDDMTVRNEVGLGDCRLGLGWGG